MTILIIGATGHVGRAASAALGERHEIIGLSRSTEPSVDLAEPGTISRALSEIGRVEAIVVTAGAVPFRPTGELVRSDLEAGLNSKVLGQLEFVLQGVDHVLDGGSITLTTGVLSGEPIATGAAAAMANGAVDAFVRTAALEMPRGIRLNAVSPGVLASAPGYHPSFPGFEPVSDEAVGRAFVRAVDGIVNGSILSV